MWNRWRREKSRQSCSVSFRRGLNAPGRVRLDDLSGHWGKLGVTTNGSYRYCIIVALYSNRINHKNVNCLIIDATDSCCLIPWIARIEQPSRPGRCITDVRRHLFIKLMCSREREGGSGGAEAVRAEREAWRECTDLGGSSLPHLSFLFLPTIV
jgi:hypothetical protein